MIELDSPIIIFPDVYEALLPVRVEIDLRAQRGEFHMGPVKVTADAVYLGKEERGDAGVAYRYPNPVRAMTLEQNLNDPDPTISALIRSFAIWLEEIEPILAIFLTAQREQIGTQMWNLDGAHVPLGNRVITTVVNEMRTTAPTRTVARTLGAETIAFLRTVSRTVGPIITPSSTVARTLGPIIPPLHTVARTIDPTVGIPVVFLRTVSRTMGPIITPSRTVARTVDPTVDIV